MNQVPFGVVVNAMLNTVGPFLLATSQFTVSFLSNASIRKAIIKVLRLESKLCGLESKLCGFDPIRPLPTTPIPDFYPRQPESAVPRQDHANVINQNWTMDGQNSKSIHVKPRIPVNQQETRHDTKDNETNQKTSNLQIEDIEDLA